MLMMFDFQCEDCSSTFDELVQSNCYTSPCVACKGNGVRLISAPRIDWAHMGTDPAFPSCYKKWGDAKTIHHRTGKDSMHKGRGTSLLMY